MQRTNQLLELEATIKKESFVIVFIGENSCSTSGALDAKITELINKYPKVSLIQTTLKEIPTIASRFMVLVAPIVLLFVNGKEVYRGDRYLRFAELKRTLDNFIATDECTIVTGKKYRHYKGNEYLVLHVAKHTETEEELVIYQALYGERGIWARPLTMFMEKVVVNGEQVYRFQEME